jgi:hypothetical protein
MHNAENKLLVLEQKQKKDSCAVRQIPPNPGTPRCWKKQV